MEILKDYLPEIITAIVSVITAGTACLVAWFKTRQKSIEKKVDVYLNEKNKPIEENENLLKNYYFIYENKKIYLNEIDIKKED